MRIIIEYELNGTDDATDLLKGIHDDLKHVWKRVRPQVGDTLTLTDDNFDPIGKIRVLE